MDADADVGSNLDCEVTSLSLASARARGRQTEQPTDDGYEAVHAATTGPSRRTAVYMCTKSTTVRLCNYHDHGWGKRGANSWDRLGRAGGFQGPWQGGRDGRKRRGTKTPPPGALGVSGARARSAGEIISLLGATGIGRRAFRTTGLHGRSRHVTIPGGEAQGHQAKQTKISNSQKPEGRGCYNVPANDLECYPERKHRPSISTMGDKGWGGSQRTQRAGPHQSNPDAAVSVSACPRDDALAVRTASGGAVRLLELL